MELSTTDGYRQLLQQISDPASVPISQKPSHQLSWLPDRDDLRCELEDTLREAGS